MRDITKTVAKVRFIYHTNVLDVCNTHYNNHLYTAINKGNEQYKIIKYKHILGAPRDWLDEILCEVVGDDWRDYDDE